MSWRYEKEENGKYAIVIDGWENGIAPDPYSGIGRMYGVNIGTVPGEVSAGFPLTVSSTSGTTSPASASTTTAINNSWVLGAVGVQTDAGDITITKSASETQRQNWSKSSQERQGVADQPAATAGSFTSSWTESANRNWAIAVVGFKEYSAVGPANVKTWDGTALASVKTVDGLAIASVKTINGLN